MKYSLINRYLVYDAVCMLRHGREKMCLQLINFAWQGADLTCKAISIFYIFSGKIMQIFTERITLDDRGYRFNQDARLPSSCAPHSIMNGVRLTLSGIKKQVCPGSTEPKSPHTPGRWTPWTFTIHFMESVHTEACLRDPLRCKSSFPRQKK